MKRKQLTLFLDSTESTTIEFIREQFNPQQYALIGSHITLCREDELKDWNRILKNLEHLNVQKFALLTGEVQRFADGKGVFLSIQDDELHFKNLRAAVLQDGRTVPRSHTAHVTLMHPRNSTCDEKKFDEILSVAIPRKLTISKISFIEQEIGKEWKTLGEYQLQNRCLGKSD